MRIAYDDTADGLAVSIEIIGGMAAPPPDSSEPDEQDDGDKRYGWYIACNGRIVFTPIRRSSPGGERTNGLCGTGSIPGFWA